jgi:hypothetical protein
MGYWIEIHCDINSDVADETRPYFDRTCFNHQNHNPGLMTFSSQLGIQEIRRRAKAIGWKHHYITGWICPHCQKFPPKD